MRITNTDLAVMIDFEFEPGRPPKGLEREFPDGGNKQLEELYEDYRNSQGWLWYRPKGLAPGGAPLFQELCRVYRQAPVPKGSSTAIGRQFMYLPDRGVGVATVWLSDPKWLSDDPQRSGPWEAKHWAQKTGYWTNVLEDVGLTSKTKVPSERIYEFLAVRVDAQDLTSYCHDDAATVATWFTGGDEYESLEQKVKLVGPDNNISHRSYERLFIRWTDALALYNLNTIHDNEDDYRLARCRAAQLFEHCILARRIFRTDGEQIAELSNKIRLVTSFPVFSKNWSEANNVLSAFSQAELEMVVAPPVRSVEAGDLVRQAIERCGIPTLVDDTRRGYDLLDRRLQWARGQWLATIAICAFLANILATIFVAIFTK